MTVLLDGSVIDHILKGNQQAALALKRLVASGRRVYVSRVAYNELMVDPIVAPQAKALLEELKISVAPQLKGSMEQRVDIYRKNIEYRPDKGGVKGFDPQNKLGRPGDLFVAAEAKGLNADLWTMDGGIVKAARAEKIRPGTGVKMPGGGPKSPKVYDRVFDVDIHPNSETVPKKTTTKVANLRLARRNLGLSFDYKAFLGGLKGKINISPKVMRIAGGVGLSIALGIIGSWLQSRYERKVVERGTARVAKEAEAALDKLTLDIARWQLKLDDGEKLYANVFVEIHTGYWQMAGVSPSMVPPGERWYDYDYQSAVNVFFKDVQLSTKNLNFKEGVLRERNNMGAMRETHIWSFEVEIYNKAQLEGFRGLADEYITLKRIRRTAPSAALDVIFHQLRLTIVALYGDDLWIFADEV